MHLRSHQYIHKGLKELEQKTGISIYLIILGLIVIVIVAIIIIIYCKKRTNRDLYSETPQHFSYRPSLNWWNKRKFNMDKIVSLTNKSNQRVSTVQDYEGQSFEVKFNKNNSCLLYNELLTSDCYFQVQLLRDISLTQIGFVHKNDKDKLVKEVDQGNSQIKYLINLDSNGVSISTDGTVISYGINNYEFEFPEFVFGDVLGIGITSGKQSRRVWITKNGELLNPPTEEENVEQLNIEDAQGLKTKKKQGKQGKQAKQGKQQQKDRKKIEVKSSKKFQYFAVLVLDSGEEKETLIHWNVGASSFRFYDGNRLKGLLQ